MGKVAYSFTQDVFAKTSQNKNVNSANFILAMPLERNWTK